MRIRAVQTGEKQIIDQIVKIHLRAFDGFFLTFLGKGFLKVMYTCYTKFEKADLLVAEEDEKVLGFVSYSGEMSGLYKYMIKRKLFSFAWFSFLAFLRKPSIFLRLLKAFLKPGDSKREERYVELSSICVDPEIQTRGIGSELIREVIARTDFSQYAYIALETDAENNEAANIFYRKNGFVLHRTYTTSNQRKMNEYRYRNEDPRS